MNSLTQDGTNHEGFITPPKKPKDEHKRSITVTLNPETWEWLKKNYSILGFRSESHAVDEAIRMLMLSKK